MKKKKLNITGGITMTHFYKGGIIAMAGGVMLTGGHHIIGITTIIIGLLLVISIMGAQFDFTNQRFRVYLFLIVKVGVWSPFKNYHRVVLESTYKSLPYTSIKNSDGSRLISCAICFERKDGFREEVKEFVDYNNALQLYTTLLENTSLSGLNEVEQLFRK